MKETDKAWLACAIDGEGYIGIVHRKQWKRTYGNFARVMVCNNNKEFVSKAAELMKTTVLARVGGKEERNNTNYYTQLHRKDDIKKILKELLPYLIVKKDKAIEALNFLKVFPKEGNPKLSGRKWWDELSEEGKVMQKQHLDRIRPKKEVG